MEPIATQPDPFASDSPPPGRAWDMAFFLAAVALAVLFRPPFFTDWDSFDYTFAAIRGEPSSLAFGRMFFMGMHALAWQVAHNWFGLDVAHAFTLFRNLTIVLGGLAAVAVFRATLHLTQSRYAAIVAGLIWITGPQPIIYAGSIMTETPTMLLFAVAIVLTELAVRRRSAAAAAALAGLAGGAFAMAFNMREPLIVFGVYFAGRCILGPTGWRNRVAASAAFVICLAMVSMVGIGLAAWRLGGFDVWRGQFEGWINQMAEERKDYPNVPLNNAHVLLWFSASVSVLALFWIVPATVYGIKLFVSELWTARRSRLTPLAWLFAGNGLYLVSLLANHDTPVNPRFALPLIMPFMLLEGFVLAEVVRRRQHRWLITFVCFGLASMVLVAVVTSWSNAWYSPPRFPIIAWLLLVLVGLLLIVLTRQAIKEERTRQSFALAAAIPALVSGYFLLAALPILKVHFYNHSADHKKFIDAAMAPGVLPHDAMIIPSKHTPAMQYIIKTGQHEGWIIPGLPYNRADLLNEVERRPGWFIVSSGWNWPDGRDFENKASEQRKVSLVEVVQRYLRAGKRVFIYGGGSMWGPPDYPSERRTEWPEVRQLQENFVISETETSYDLFEVLDRRPAPGSHFWPIGNRKAIWAGNREPKQCDLSCHVPATQQDDASE